MGESRTVVRITRNYYRQKTGDFVFQLKISILKRKSKGHQVIEEDYDNVGTKNVIDKIINLHEVEGGIYELIECNIKTDWETGYVDGWDYQLIEYKE